MESLIQIFSQLSYQIRIEHIIICFLLAVILFLLYAYLHLRQDDRKFVDLAGKDSRKEALRVLEEARSKAVSIVSQAQLDAHVQQAQFDNQLLAARQQLLEEYKEIIQNISKDTADATMRELKDLTAFLESQLITAKESMKTFFDDEKKLAEKNIAQYQADKVQFINDHFYDYIKQLSEEVLKVSINKQAYESEALELLDEFKKRHV